MLQFISGCNTAEALVQSAIQYIVKAMEGFASQPENVMKAFDILESLVQLPPKLLKACHVAVLPTLLRILDVICVELRHKSLEPTYIDRMFDALEKCCENLNEAIVPYFPMPIRNAECRKFDEST